MLSLCLLFSFLVPMPVKADDSIITVDGYEYKILNDHEVKLLEYFYADDVDISNPYIPEEISYNGKKYNVTELYISAGGHLKKLIAPEGMKRIELNEFGSFSDLEELHLPSTLEGINAGFCYSMENLKKIVFAGQEANYENDFYQLRDGVLIDKKNKELICYPAASPARVEYVVPEGIVTLRKGCFTNVKYLENLSMSSTVKSVNGGIFAHANIKSIDFKDVEYVISGSGSNIFEWCKKLETVKIGPKLKFSSGSPFYENDSLKTIEISPENPYYEMVDGVMFGQTNKGRTLISYPAALERTEYTIPEDTQYIGYSSFNMCHNLKKIMIPKSVSAISTAAFNYGDDGLSKNAMEIDFYGDSLPSMTKETFCDLQDGSKICFKDQTLVDQFNQKNKEQKYIYFVDSSKKVLIETLPKVATEAVSLNKKEITGLLEDYSGSLAQDRLIVQINPVLSTDLTKFSSSNEFVVMVDDYGVVTMKNPGNATISVQSGTKKDTCNVQVKGHLEDSGVLSASAKSLWTGGPVQAYVYMTYRDQELKEGRDYKLSYENNNKPGNATVVITGIGKYAGVAKRDFKIEKYQEASTTEQPRPTVPATAEPTVQTKKKITYVSNPSNATYTGKSIKKGLSVKAGRSKLKLNRDYTISYTGNKNCGKVKMVVRGKGDYTGSFTRYFKIKPKKAKIKKLKTGKKKMTVYISKSAGKVSGYQIRYSKYKNFKKSKYKTTKRTVYTLKKLSRKKYYYIKVRAYKVIDGKKHYGSYSVCKKIKVK